MRKQNYLSKTNVQVGISLALASLGIVCGDMLATAIGFLFGGPVASYFIFGMEKIKWNVLREGPGDVALLEKVKATTKETLDQYKTELRELANKAKEGMIDQKTFNEKFEEIGTKLKGFDAEKFKSFEETIQKYEQRLKDNEAAAKAQAEELKKLKEGGLDGKGQEDVLRKKLKEIMGSTQWKEFVESGGKRKASFELKAVDVTNSFTGTSRVSITTRSPRIIDHPIVNRLNIRDLLTVIPTDLPYLAFIEVYDWVRNIGTVTENGMLPESSFKVREATTDVKRIGTYVNLSKRMLRSVPFIENYLASVLPAMVRYAEDFQLLWGDGTGNNPLGLTEVGQEFATAINATVTGIAGSIASVAAYDGTSKSLITFTNNVDLVNGDNITIAGGAGGQTTYNATHKAIVRSPREIVIDLAYVAGSTAAWTFTVGSRFKDNIPAAQEIDVLKIAKALVTRREYSATGIILHPDDVAKIETLKGNDNHYLDIQRDGATGIARIGGTPIVETTAMPSGFFMVGDFTMAAALLELTALQLEFSESTQEKLTNTVVAIIQEEILFPIYNKFMFVYGNFATAIPAILP